jgi:CRISPR/Cas system CSM-associated protein Csm2 small subunit
MMGQQLEEEGVGGKDDKNDFDGKELALELLRIISSDFSLNELAFVPPWKHLRELLGEKFADDEEDQNDRKRLKLFYRSFCVREHKLAINAHVIVPVLNYVYSQLRRKKDENNDDAFLDDDLKVLLCVLTGDSLSGWNVRRRRVLEALEKDGDKTSDDEEKKNRTKESELLEREMMFATFVQTKFPKSTAAFAHRRWVIMTCCFHGGGAERRNHLITRNARRDTTMLSLLLLHNVYERETLACEQTCRRKLSNYAAWAHKLFVFELVHVKQNVNEPDELLERAKSVLRESKTNISSSDPSAWHFRRAVIRSVYDRLLHYDAMKKRFFDEVIVNEFRFVREKIAAFRGRETLWHHRKTVLAHVLLKCSDDDVRNEIVTEEIEFAINNNNEADEIKVRDVPWATKYEDGDEARLLASFSKYVCTIFSRFSKKL